MVDTFRALLSIRNFRLFLIGQLVSNTGTWMQRVAQDWLVLQLTHNSGTAVGITTGLQFLPQLLFGLWGGVIADRYPKRRLLLITQGVMGVQALVLGVLTVTGTAHVYHVYALAFLLGLAAAADSPARQAFIHEMVGPAHVPNAVGLNSAQFNGARIIGPAIAGLLIASLGTGSVFLVNAASYVAVLAGLLAIRPAELHAIPRPARADSRLRDALRYVREQPELLLPITVVGFVGTFGLNFTVTISLMAKQEFASDAAAFGYLSTAFAVGALLGALGTAARRTPPSRRRLVGAAVLFGLLEIAVGLMPTYWTFLALLVPTGVFALTVTTTANAMTQINSDPLMRGRVMSIYLLVFLGGTPIGSPLVGWVADNLGVRWSLILGGLISALAAVAAALVFSPARGRKAFAVGVLVPARVRASGGRRPATQELEDLEQACAKPA